MISAGVWLSVVLLIGVGGWIAATWSQPHRGGLVAMAERLRLALSARMSACAGVASSDAEGPDADALYRRADEHLYEGKRARPTPLRHALQDVQIA
jgi:GGDEF domain-containing protein